ncbi:cupin domain-containing protein [Nitrospinota bacterium]
MPYYQLFELEKVREEASPLAEIQRVKGELMKAGLVTYLKGEYPRPHSHPNEEQFVLVLEGRRYSIIGDEERVVGPGDLMHIPRNTRHGAITLDEKVVSFVVKSPAGTGVMGQDYHEAEDAEEVIKRLEEKLEELG